MAAEDYWVPRVTLTAFSMHSKRSGHHVAVWKCESIRAYTPYSESYRRWNILSIVNGSSVAREREVLSLPGGWNEHLILH